MIMLLFFILILLIKMNFKRVYNKLNKTGRENCKVLEIARDWVYEITEKVTLLTDERNLKMLCSIIT